MDMNDMAPTSSASKKSGSSATGGSNLTSCSHSGLRLKKREKPPEYVDSLVDGFKYLHCHYIATGHTVPEVEWCSIGVVVQKITPQTVDKKGNKFTIFSISNLRDIPKVVKIMAFSEVRVELKKHAFFQIFFSLHAKFSV